MYSAIQNQVVAVLQDVAAVQLPVAAQADHLAVDIVVQAAPVYHVAQALPIPVALLQQGVAAVAAVAAVVAADNHPHEVLRHIHDVN